MKFYNSILLLCLSALLALSNAHDVPKSSDVLLKQIDAGFVLIQKISEFFTNSFMKSVFDDSVAKKKIFVYFKEHLNNHSALILNKTVANDYRTFSTDLSSALESAIASINPDLVNSKLQYKLYVTETNSKLKNDIIEATASLRNILDTNSTANNCYMKYYKFILSNKFNAISTNQKEYYKYVIAENVYATYEFVEVVKRFIYAIEEKLDYCTETSLNTVKCLNNYALFSGKKHLEIVQSYQPDLMRNGTLLLENAADENAIQQESILEVISTVEAKTKKCAKMQ